MTFKFSDNNDSPSSALMFTLSSYRVTKILLSDDEFVIAGPRLFEIKLVVFLLPEEIAARLHYFGRLDHSKPDFQVLCYPSKTIFVVHFLIDHMMCIYMFALCDWF